jgi:hypothetical protein
MAGITMSGNKLNSTFNLDVTDQKHKTSKSVIFKYPGTNVLHQ